MPKRLLKYQIEAIQKEIAKKATEIPQKQELIKKVLSCGHAVMVPVGFSMENAVCESCRQTSMVSRD